MRDREKYIAFEAHKENYHTQLTFKETVKMVKIFNKQERVHKNRRLNYNGIIK